MYTVINFKSKKALKEYVASGKPVETFQPGGMFPATRDGNRETLTLTRKS